MTLQQCDSVTAQYEGFDICQHQHSELCDAQHRSADCGRDDGYDDDRQVVPGSLGLCQPSVVVSGTPPVGEMSGGSWNILPQQNRRKPQFNLWQIRNIQILLPRPEGLVHRLQRLESLQRKSHQLLLRKGGEGGECPDLWVWATSKLWDFVDDPFPLQLYHLFPYLVETGQNEEKIFLVISATINSFIRD